MEDNDPIKNYIDVHKINATLAVVEKRVYSKCYHLQTNAKTAQGMSKNQAQEYGRAFAVKHLERWRKIVGQT